MLSAIGLCAANSDDISIFIIVFIKNFKTCCILQVPVCFPPLNLTISSIGLDTITVPWPVPDGGPNVRGIYIVTVLGAGITNTTNTIINLITFIGLTPNTRYSITITYMHTYEQFSYS